MSEKPGSEKPFTPWVVCEKPGMILAAPCNGMAGLTLTAALKRHEVSTIFSYILRALLRLLRARILAHPTSTAHSNDATRAAVTKANHAITLRR